MQKTTTTDRRIKELEALTKTNESTIQMLLLRLAKYEDEEEVNNFHIGYHMNNKKTLIKLILT